MKQYTIGMIHPEVIGMKSVDIGDWDDDHPLNLNPTSYETKMSYFKD
jgi:hypothetical protein